MSPVPVLLYAGALPVVIALASLLGAGLLHRAGADGEASAPWPARLLGAAGPAIAVALAFILLQQAHKPGTLGFWPQVAVERIPTLAGACALAAIAVGLAPRSILMAAIALAVAGATCAWGLGAPIKREPADLAPYLAAAAGWGAIAGGLWRLILQRTLADRGDPAPLAASGLVPLGAVPVCFFGGASALPQPAMALVAVAGAAILAGLILGAPRIGAVGGGLGALLASIMLLVACALVFGYRPSPLALGLLMAAPVALLPALLAPPKRALGRWALALVPMLALMAAAGLVAWQMAPGDDGYGYGY
ncbi:MAG: hypothetical protein ACF8R7_09115 [Phycisphaerales bacterium JB039]